jgi:hypothetical protein
VPSHWRAYRFPESLPCANAQAEPARLSTAFLVNARACRACAEGYAIRFVADQHLPSKRDPRLQQLHFLLLPSQVFNNLGLCFSLKANPNGMKRSDSGTVIDEKDRRPPEAESSHKTADGIATDDQCDGEGPCPFRLARDQKQRNKETQHRQKKNKPQFNRSWWHRTISPTNLLSRETAHTCYQVQILWPIGKPQKRKQP